MQTSLKQTFLFTEEKLTSLQGDSHVNHIQQQENDLGKPMKDISFQKCLGQLKKSNQDGLLAKMFVDLLVGMEGWYSTRCTMTWKGKDMKSNRFLFQLQVSAQDIKDKVIILDQTLIVNLAALRRIKRGLIQHDGDFFPTAAVHGLLASIGVMIMTRQFLLMLGVGSKLPVEPRELLADYVPSFHPRLLGLTGSEAEIAAAVRAKPGSRCG